MKKTFELNTEQIDDIIVEDLQEVYKSNLEDPAFPEILDALEVVLAYYMIPSEYSVWFVNRGRDEQTTKK
jgi:hypothetical protein